jgi:hypothetical protein
VAQRRRGLDDTLALRAEQDEETEEHSMAAAAKPSQPAAAAKQAGSTPKALTKAEQATIRVRATRMGYYGEMRRRPGDVFTVPATHFSTRWMERVDGATPEHQTTPQAALNQQLGDIRTRGAGGESSGGDGDDE